MDALVSSLREPIVFVRTGEFRKARRLEPWEHRLEPGCIGVGETAVEHHILRRLPPGWSADAAESLRALFIRAGHSVTDAEILAALFPPPEPDPEPWMQQAATTWFRIPAESRDAAELARHIAKHAAKGVS